MAKKKKTLAQQYDEQVRRIEKRLKQLANEGYDIVSEWDSTKRPKRPTRQQVEALKKVTPAKLRKRAVNNTIAVGKRVTNTPAKSTREKVARKEAARKKAEAIEQGKIILQNLYDILSLPYSANLPMKPDTYNEKVATAQSLLDNAISSESEDTILKRLAEASEEIITAVEGYIYGSDGSSGEQVSYSWMLQILYGDNIPDSENALATELEDYDITDISNDEDEDEEGDDTHILRPYSSKPNIVYNSATDTYIDTKTGEVLFSPLGNGRWLNEQTGEIVFESEIMR